MAVLGYSIYGNTVLGINEAAGKLGGVMTVMNVEPLWMARHEGTSPLELETATPPELLTVVREEAPPFVILTVTYGDG